jgi:hypothetical protein
MMNKIPLRRKYEKVTALTCSKEEDNSWRIGARVIKDDFG